MIKEKLKKYYFFRKIAKIIELNRKRNTNLTVECYDIIKKVSVCFTQNEVRFFLDFGTLLGFVREGKLFSHDLDVDFGILPLTNPQEEKLKIRTILCGIGYQLKEYYCVNGDVKEETYVSKNAHFDVYYYERDMNTNNLFCYIFCRIDGVHYNSKYEFSAGRYMYNIDIIPEHKRINGIDVMIPKNAEELLVLKYGATWRVPNKYWHYWYDSNVNDFGELGTIQIL